jgi:hypothetical protein
MAKSQKKDENPLLSKNIPQPPPSTVPSEQAKTEPGSTIPQNGNTAIPYNTVKQQDSKAKREKITFYLEPDQAGKLYDFMEAYRKRTGIKINQQDMLRRIIDVAKEETVLP